MRHTTPPRPFDVAVLFPQLAPLARTATRLHPRPGSPTPHDSSVGGPLLWPADEPWPHCDAPHEQETAKPLLSPDDVRAWRRHRRACEERRRLDPQGPWATPEELATEKQIPAGRPWPDGPIAMLPVAQLYVRDVPLLPRPAQYFPAPHSPTRTYSRSFGVPSITPNIARRHCSGARPRR